VIERFYQAIKYEHLYRHEIDDGPALAEHVDGYLHTYNRQRPTKRSSSLCPSTATPRPRPKTPPTPNLQPKNLSQLLDTGHQPTTQSK